MNSSGGRIVAGSSARRPRWTTAVCLSVLLACCAVLLRAQDGVAPAAKPAARSRAASEPPAPARFVPALAGKRVQLAEQLLRLADFRPATGVFYISPQNWRDDVRVETVYLQSPPPRAPAPVGARVALWTFEQAPADCPTVTMPDLRGKSLAQATAVLKELGLPLLEFADEQRAAEEMVVDQYPRVEQVVYRGTHVYLSGR